MIELRLRANGAVRSAEFESLDEACCRLCSYLPIDLRFGNGRSSLMTCVEFLQKFILGLSYPDHDFIHPNHSSLFAFLFYDLRVKGGTLQLLEPEVVDSITVVSQTKRDDQNPCKNCPWPMGCRMEER